MPKRDSDDASAGSDGGGSASSERGKSSSPTPGVVDRDTYPMSGITKPGPNDVLCGRGGGTNNHSGNVRFRKLVNEHKMRYLAATKVEKPKVAREVVKIWRAMDPPGRFLARTGGAKAGDGGGGGDKEGKEEKPTKGGGGVKEGSVWHDVGDKKAREKASQCLRERTPEVMPFVKKMQEQQQVVLTPGPDGVGVVGPGPAGDSNTTEPPFFDGRGGGTAADPAMSQFSNPAAAFGFGVQQGRGGGGGGGGGAGQGHPNAQAISSQFVVAPTGSGHHHHHHNQQRLTPQSWAAFASQNEDFVDANGGFTQFAHNAFQQHLAQQQAIAQQQAQIAMLQQQQQLNGGGGGLGQEWPSDIQPPPQAADELTLEEYQASLEEYIARECGLTPQAAARAVDPENARRETMEEAKANSWIKSFHSIDTTSMDMASVTSQSIRNMALTGCEDNDQDGDGEGGAAAAAAERGGSPRPAGQVTSSDVSPSSPGGGGGGGRKHDRHRRQGMPPPSTGGDAKSVTSASYRSSKLKQSKMEGSCASNISMFTDATGFSSVGVGTAGGGGGGGEGGAAKSKRSVKMRDARTLKSDISMMSELTDLSASMSLGTK